MSLFGFSGTTHEKSAVALERYNKEKTSIDQEHQKRLNSEIKKIEDQHKNEISFQNDLSRTISRVSPVSCFIFLISELSGTGLLETDNIEHNAMVFHRKVNEDIYRPYNIHEYYTANSSYLNNPQKDDGFDKKVASVPHMDAYKSVSTTEILRAEWIDMLLLVLYTILFFAGAFVGFLRYDVR